MGKGEERSQETEGRIQNTGVRIQESESPTRRYPPHAQTPRRPPNSRPQTSTPNSDTPTRPYPPLPRAQVGKAAKVFLWQRRGVITALARIQSESHERFDKFYPSSDAVDDWNADFPADDFA